MIEVLSDPASLRQLEPDWRRLAAEHPSPMVQFEWVWHCAENLCEESALQIFVLRHGTMVRAIAPMVRRRHAPWIETLGSAQLYEPTDLLYADMTSLQKLLAGMVANRAPINLQRLPADSPIFEASKTVCRGRALRLVRPSAGSSYIPITSDWETFLESVSSVRRADFRRKRARAERVGEPAISVSCPDPAGLGETLDLCFRIEAAGWKGKNGTALRDNQVLRNFFVRYAETAARKGILRVFIYRVDTQPVAMHIGVEFGRRLWIYKLGYDEAWSRLSPGMHLANETIRYAFERQLRGYEFLGSEEAWQHVWPVSTHSYRSLLIYPASWPGLRGLLGSVASFARNRLS